MKITRWYFLFLLPLLQLTAYSAIAQEWTVGCSYVYNTATGGPAIPNNADNIKICITAANRTESININNATNVTIVIAENTVMTGDIQNLKNDTRVILLNYGQYGSSSSQKFLTLGFNSSHFYNYGRFYGSFTSNNGADITNTSNIYGSVTLNSGQAIYTNSGSHTGGSLSLNDGSRIDNTGTLGLTALTANSNTIFTNSAEGVVSVSQSIVLNNTFSNQGALSVTGGITVNGGSVLSNTGSITTTGSYQNNGKTLSPTGTIDIGGDFTNNGGAKFEVGEGTVAGNTQNNGDVLIYGNLDISGWVNNNGGANISAGNNAQPNYLDVGGTVTNNGCIKGNDGILYLNKVPTGNGNCLSGDIFMVGNSGDCLQVVVIPNYVVEDEEMFERVYIFKCSMVWDVPKSTNEYEVMDAVSVFMVGGGGGGGKAENQSGRVAGGGGAGGVITNSAFDLSKSQGTSIQVTVGGGGLGSSSNSTAGSNGQNSSILSLIAYGGGGGGSSNGQNQGKAGGSGGGAGSSQNTPQSGGNIQNASSPSLSYGYAGASANGTDSNRTGGGGGGARGAGTSGSNKDNPGKGGNSGSPADFGVAEMFSLVPSGVVPTEYGGGGGPNTESKGGLGGGTVGGSGNHNGNGTDGITNTGSGGGAGRGDNNGGRGGAGGSGIVVLRQVFRILPAELVSFTAAYTSNPKTVTLRWTTAQEHQLSHFEIERSVGGISSWTKIGQVGGQVFSANPSSYQFTDQSLPAQGGRLYYRLRQILLDKTPRYSSTISVEIPAMESDHRWLAYPNPTDGSDFQLLHLAPDPQKDRPIYAVLGSPMGTQDIVKGDSVEEISRNLSELLVTKVPGIYLLKLASGEKSEVLKIIKR